MNYDKRAMARWRNLKHRATTHDGGSVYLIRAQNGLYKIGHSKNVEARLKSLRAMSPIPLELIHSVKFRETTDLENALHEKFADKQHHGEWFALGNEDVEFICGLVTDGIGNSWGPLR